MIEEMNALEKNSTWELVDLPREHTTVGCKWVFTVKLKLDGDQKKRKYFVKMMLKKILEESHEELGLFIFFMQRFIALLMYHLLAPPKMQFDLGLRNYLHYSPP